ncbi:hypothetical protein SteCoe_10889 [Stentor coeruleus]|uniref:DUF4485 domain-containing protein n=1 Tax=Stentor coeruleus TaxID=5963 RepID=A0A1R2CED2_9CILI|nr:hypothetical protein SteCoe_10889 [Stentor coeruleus]
MEKDKVEEEFIETMLEVEKHYGSMSKHEKVRIEQWSKKLCQITANPLWKKNRNKYAKFLLQLVKIGQLQEPFTKIPPEGPLPQFNGNIYIQPSRPRPRSSAEGHIQRNPSNTELQKPSDIKVLETKIIPKHPDSPLFEQKPPVPKSVEKRNLDTNSSFKSNNDRYDTHIVLNTKVNEDLIRLQTQLEIAQLNEKHLRDELGKRNKKIAEQAEEIEYLRKENENLKIKLAAKEQKREFFDECKNPKQRDLKLNIEKSRNLKEELNLDDISDNLRRLEQLQDDLNKNRFS